jgi:hypothetical protein
MPEDTQREEHATQSMPPACPRCGNNGWWTDKDGFHYCTCAAGIRAEDEDGTGGD